MDGHIEQTVGIEESISHPAWTRFFIEVLCFVFCTCGGGVCGAFGGVTTSHQFISVAEPNCRNRHVTYRIRQIPRRQCVFCSTKMHDMICTSRIIGPSLKGFDYV